MTRTVGPGALVLTLTLLVVQAPNAGARECPLGCTVQRRACVQTARVTQMACKLGCRQAASPDACVRSCRYAYGSRKAACGADRLSCLGDCEPPTPPADGGCLVHCGEVLAACAHAVVEDATTCVQRCHEAADHLTCLQECAARALSGATACAQGFVGCLADCAPPSSTTTTTLPPPHRCGLDVEHGTCGGECPPDLVCGPTPPGFDTALPCLCLPHANECAHDEQCADDNPCTFDRCTFGRCEHLCLCVAPGGRFTCCPGPAAECSPIGAFLDER